jgi:hypothetical protein
MGWLWQRAQPTDIPRNARDVVSAMSVGSSWRTKKFAAPFSSVLPFAVTMARTKRSQGVLAATWFRIQV